jgi:hypothetical protein
VVPYRASLCQQQKSALACCLVVTEKEAVVMCVDVRVRGRAICSLSVREFSYLKPFSLRALEICPGTGNWPVVNFEK